MSTIDPTQLKWPVTVTYRADDPLFAPDLKDLKSKDKANQLTLAPTGSGEVQAQDAGGKAYKGLDALGAAYAAVGLFQYFKFCRLPGYDSGHDFR
jgi:hypothetical protein